MFRRANAKRRRELHGLEVAVGLTPEEPTVDDQPTAGLACPTCQTIGHIDMVDTAGGRAYLTCPRCERNWDTDRSAIRI